MFFSFFIKCLIMHRGDNTCMNNIPIFFITPAKITWQPRNG